MLTNYKNNLQILSDIRIGLLSVFYQKKIYLALIRSQNSILFELHRNLSTEIDVSSDLFRNFEELSSLTNNTMAIDEYAIATDYYSDKESIRKMYGHLDREHNDLDYKHNDLANKYKESAEKFDNWTLRLAEQMKSVGIGIHGTAFSDEAEKNTIASWCFLGATIAVSIAIVCFSYRLLSEVVHAPYMDVSNAISWQGMIYRLIIFSTLSYIFVFCAKNYTNMKHNATLNKHRQNALSTFTAFTETQQNPDVRDKITLLAAYCIFGHQSTGFLKNNKDDDSVINVWSIIESVITKKQSNS